MINSIYILNHISYILKETVNNWRSTYPDLRVSGCDLNSRAIWIENFEFINNGKKINQVYTKGKLEAAIHPCGKIPKEPSLENLITSISFKLLLNDREPVSFYKWESKQTSGLLKKEDRFDLSICNVSKAFEITLEDVISKELPKFIGYSKEKKLSEDQLRKISSFEALPGLTN